MSRVKIFIDGSFDDNSDNPQGGWACLIKDRLYVESGSVPSSFSAELEGLLLALKESPKGKQIELFCDSQTVVNGFNKRIKAGLDASTKQGKCRFKSDRRRWRAILRLAQGRDVIVSWVKGHDTCLFNAMVDRAANRARRERINYVEKTAQRLRAYT